MPDRVRPHTCNPTDPEPTPLPTLRRRPAEPRPDLPMKAAVIVFPGSNWDRDARVALQKVTGAEAVMHWHNDPDLPDVDLMILPGGFSHGDYLRPLPRHADRHPPRPGRRPRPRDLQRLSNPGRMGPAPGRPGPQPHPQVHLP